MKEDWHVKVDGEIAQAVRAYAKASGIALAAAVSILLKRGLEGMLGYPEQYSEIGLNPAPGGPVLDGYCRGGSHGTCIGPPGARCDCSCHLLSPAIRPGQSRLLYGHYVASLTPCRDEFFPAQSLEWVAGYHDGLTQDRSKRGQGDADYDAGWYRGYVSGCTRVAEESGTCVPEGNREYWDHFPAPSTP